MNPLYHHEADTTTVIRFVREEDIEQLLVPDAPVCWRGIFNLCLILAMTVIVWGAIAVGAYWAWKALLWVLHA